MKLLKTILLVLAAATLSIAQSLPAYPTLTPAAVVVNYDKAVDTTVKATITVSTVQGTAAGNTAFAYTVIVPDTYMTVVTPVPLYAAANYEAPVTESLVVNARSLPVGNYQFPVVFFNSSYNYSVSAWVNLAVSDSGSTTGPSKSDLLVPHIAVSDVWTTTLRMVNTTANTSTSKVKFYTGGGDTTWFSVNGNHTEEMTVTVPANGLVDLVLSGQTTLKTGTASVTAVTGMVPNVNVFYTSTNPVFTSAVETKLTSASFTLAFDNIGLHSTGIAVGNAYSGVSAVTLNFYDETGVALGSFVVNIPSMGQFISTLNLDFAATKGKRGLVKVNAANPGITGFALHFDNATGTFYTGPAF